MQIRMVQRLKEQLSALDDLFEVMERNDTTRNNWTKEFIEKVQAIIDETPQRPIRQIARDLGVSHTTVKACVGPIGARQARSWLRRQRTSG